MIKPGLNSKSFKVLFKDEYFKKGATIESANETIKIKVLNTPKRKWYHILLKWITFGWFRAKWTYKVKAL
jgi:hypothetical protein